MVQVSHSAWLPDVVTRLCAQHVAGCCLSDAVLQSLFYKQMEYIAK
jgi:hypothetical protein